MSTGVGEVVCDRCTCRHSIVTIKPHVLSEMISSKNQFLTKSKLRRDEARSDMIKLAQIYVSRVGFSNTFWTPELLKSMIPLQQPGITLLKRTQPMFVQQMLESPPPRPAFGTGSLQFPMTSTLPVPAPAPIARPSPIISSQD